MKQHKSQLRRAKYFPPCPCPATLRRFEFWESNVAGRLGLGVALRYAMDIGMQPIETRIRQLASLLRERLDNEPGVSVMDLGRAENQCGIVSFTVAGMDPGDVKEGLRLKSVYVSTSAAGSTPLDAESRALPTVVRAVAGEHCTARTAPCVKWRGGGSENSKGQLCGYQSKWVLTALMIALVMPYLEYVHFDFKDDRGIYRWGTERYPFQVFLRVQVSFAYLHCRARRQVVLVFGVTQPRKSTPSANVALP